MFEKDSLVLNKRGVAVLTIYCTVVLAFVPQVQKVLTCWYIWAAMQF